MSFPQSEAFMNALGALADASLITIWRANMLIKSQLPH